MSRGLKTLGLTMTRRCPKSHVAEVTGIVPDFEATADAPEGTVESVPLAVAIEGIAAGDMVQCRNNAPLTSLCWRLLKRGLKVQIAGREIGDGLLALIKRLSKGSNDLAVLLQRVEAYREKETAKMENLRNGESAKAALDDKCDCIVFLSEGVDDVPALNAHITGIFADFDETGTPKESVLLTTTHKAKGLEADNVWIYKPALYPAKWAVQEWELKQEQNLIYVRDTRSKNRLIRILED